MSERARLRAEFELDDDGKPTYVQGKRLKHYRVRLRVEGLPSTIEAVTVRLDPSYRDPVREVFRDEKGAAGFTESITAYGDFEIEVSPSGASGSKSLSEERLVVRRLSAALIESAKTQDGDREAIRAALKELRGH